MLPPYTKPHLSFPDQLRLLMDRGMEVTDELKAIGHLHRIGYGRLAPYWRTFQQSLPDPDRPGRTRAVSTFRPGAAFSHAVDLYLFDKQLRLLFLDAVERIEVALRVDLAHALGKRDPWAHRMPALLDRRRADTRDRSSGTTRHDAWLDKADVATARHQEDWLVEFRQTYRSPPPVWMATETWEYGTLSRLLEMAHPNDRAAIAKRYGLLPDTLVSWNKTLVVVRNICAHHARLWNASIVNQPQVPRPHEAPAAAHIGTDPRRRNRVYGAVVVASHLVQRICPGSSWTHRVRDHWKAFPSMPFATPAHAGFFAGWDQEPAWNVRPERVAG